MYIDNNEELFVNSTIVSFRFAKSRKLSIKEVLVLDYLIKFAMTQKMIEAKNMKSDRIFYYVDLVYMDSHVYGLNSVKCQRNGIDDLVAKGIILKHNVYNVKCENSVNNYVFVSITPTLIKEILGVEQTNHIISLIEKRGENADNLIAKLAKQLRWLNTLEAGKCSNGQNTNCPANYIEKFAAIIEKVLRADLTQIEHKPKKQLPLLHTSTGTMSNFVTADLLN